MQVGAGPIPTPLSQTWHCPAQLQQGRANEILIEEALETESEQT